MGRSPICKKEVLKRGPWTTEEDQILTAYIQKHGHGSWRALPEKAGLQRCGKSCRLRWINYLRPDIKRGKFSLQEEQTIIQLHALLGNRWSAMAAHLPKRTDNEIKNHWNTHLKKRLIKMGIDPMTHKPRADASVFPSASVRNTSNLSHMAQWENARLEAEARLVRESKQVTPTPIQAVANARNKLQLTPTSSAQPMFKSVAAGGRPRCLDVLKAWQGVVSGMFTFFNQDLESPTSTLSFPDGNRRVNPVTAAAGCMDDENGFDKSNQMEEFDEGRTLIDAYMNLHGDLDSTDIMVGNDHENNCLPFSNIMVGVSDTLLLNSEALNSSMDVEKSTQSCNGNMAENSSNCWDTVLNLLNSSPYGSPMF